MNRRSIYQLCLSAVFFLLTLSALPAQHAKHEVSAVTPTKSEPIGAFSVRSFGAYRNMVQKQDYSAKVTLGDVRSFGLTDAVGALSGLRGEITMIDGRFVVSYGGGCKNCPQPHAETATLLGAGEVSEWSVPLALPSDLAGNALDEFIIAEAKRAGLDTSKPFPIRLKGTLVDVAMHVIEAPNPGFQGHGSKVHMAKQDEYKHAVLRGEVVGIYAPADMQGVLSHPGEPFHYHWVNIERTQTAHLDAFGMQKGSLLVLPKR